MKETLRRTEGWLELGCGDEAFEELESLPDSLHTTREVLKLKCRALRVSGHWAELKVMAATAVMYFPSEPAFSEEWAWAEHQLGRTVKAYSILNQPHLRYRSTWRTAYYLACFSYQMNRAGEATAWLGRALLAHPSPSEIALEALHESAFQAAA